MQTEATVQCVNGKFVSEKRIDMYKFRFTNNYEQIDDEYIQLNSNLFRTASQYVVVNMLMAKNIKKQVRRKHNSCRAVHCFDLCI